MKTYLVDFENVKSKGLMGIDSLNETDTVIIFYSENSDTISFEMHQKVLTSKAEVEYFKVNVGGKNALDFQLSTLLGYLVGRDAYTHIFVISNDKGFDFLHDFWHGKYIAAPNCTVYRTRTIAAAINYSSDIKKKITQNVSAAQQPDLTADIQELDEAAAEISKAEEIPDTEITMSSDEQPITVEIGVQQEQQDAVYVIAQTQPKMQEAQNADQTQGEQKLNEIKPSESKKDDEKGECAKEAAEEASKKGGAGLDEIKRILAPAKCGDGDVKAIEGMLAAAKTKEELHNLLAKTFKQEATELYKLLRPNYLKLKAFYEEESSSAQVDTENAQTQQAEQPLYSDVISSRLAKLLAGLCTDEEFAKIHELFINAPTRQQLYIRMVKVFKKDKGCRFYNTIKTEYVDLHK